MEFRKIDEISLAEIADSLFSINSVFTPELAKAITPAEISAFIKKADEVARIEPKYIDRELTEKIKHLSKVFSFAEISPENLNNNEIYLRRVILAYSADLIERIDEY